MGRKSAISSEEKFKILPYKDLSLSYREIGKEIGSACVVCCFLKNESYYGSNIL